MGKSDSFDFHWKFTKHLSHFSKLSSRYLNVLCNAYIISLDLFCVLQPDVIKVAFQRRNPFLGFFFLLPVIKKEITLFSEHGVMNSSCSAGIFHDVG